MLDKITPLMYSKTKININKNRVINGKIYTYTNRHHKKILSTLNYL